MTNPAKKPTLTEQAEQMARDGYGYEDIAKELKISHSAAWWFVFKRPYRRNRP